MQDKQKVILFDLDGTLIDSTDAILDGFHHSFNPNFAIETCRYKEI